ncbi:MAG TPA: delta-60 repeat domain-containing protein, partial [Pyrinomonadaceae bacterium]|nr:delta-60 repeat domain-containing protein [Pyrinomonadaceae bacterium]
MLHSDKYQSQLLFNLSFIAAVLFYTTLTISAQNMPGDLDPTFSGDGKLADWSGGASKVAIQPDGKIVVAGEYGLGVGNPAIGIARYNPDGSPDTTFGSGSGKVITLLDLVCAATGLAIQPDGKIVVSAVRINGASASYHSGLLRYNADGSRDTSFGSFGVVLMSDFFPADVAIQPDG